MHRVVAGLSKTLLSIVAGGAVIALLSGSVAIGLLPGLLVVGLVMYVTRNGVRRKRTAPDPGWTPPIAFTYVPSAGHATASPHAVSLALGRAEARELFASGSFGVGLGFCFLTVVLFGLAFRSDFSGEIAESIELAPILVHPLVGLTVLAAFLGRLRSVHDGCEELFDSCPTGAATRTLGHLRAGWVPALVGIVTVVLTAVLLATKASALFGPMGARQAANVLGAGVLGVGGVALGVALARWLPWRPVPILAVVGVGMVAARLGTAGDRTSEPLRQLSTFLGDREVAIRFTAPHWIAHHLWVVLLAVAVSLIALLRDGDRRRLGAALAFTGVLAAVAAVAATRPIDGEDAQRIATLIGDPAMQTCRDGAVPICTYRGDGELADFYGPHVDAVVAAVPARSLDGVSLREGATVKRDDLDPEIVRLLPEPDPSVVPFDLIVHDDAVEGARFWLALTAVGAVEDYRPGPTVSLRGQARGVIAIWAATRGLEPDRAARMARSDPNRDPADPSNRPWPDTCYAGVAPVQWATSDLFAAQQVLAAPDAEVRAVVLADWDHLVDRHTSTDDLLLALGLEPVGRVEGFTPTGNSC